MYGPGLGPGRDLSTLSGRNNISPTYHTRGLDAPANGRPYFVDRCLVFKRCLRAGLLLLFPRDKKTIAFKFETAFL